MKSFLVIGMGNFGRCLAVRLKELGNDVMAVDSDEEKLGYIEGKVTDCFVGDCLHEGVLRSLGVSNFDVCFVTIDRDLQASLEITSMLKELGAKHVVSNAIRERQATFLKKIGADEVIFPERDMAEKAAIKYDAHNVFDYIHLGTDYSLFEIKIPDEWADKTIAEVNVRKNYNVSIIAIVNPDETLDAMPGADYVFEIGDRLVVIGKNEDVEKLSKMQ